MIFNAFRYIEGSWTFNRVTYLLSILLLMSGFQSHVLAFSNEIPRDTVIIDGHIIKIKAKVDIDTIGKRPEKTAFRKWLDDADFIAIGRVGEEIGGDNVLGDGFYRVKNETRFPELSLETAHPLGESFQLHYRGGISLGLSKYFDESGIHENAIGFDWEGSEILEFIITEDPLGPEVDTLKAPIRYSPKLKLALGLEWQGVMRGARGWIWGAQVEWIPKKDERVLLYSPDSIPENWGTIPSDSTYDIISDETNSLQLRAFTSWSPWNFPWFLRAEVCWAPTITSAWVALGYRW